MDLLKRIIRKSLNLSNFVRNFESNYGCGGWGLHQTTSESAPVFLFFHENICEVLLTRTHNIGFYVEIRKLPQLLVENSALSGVIKGFILRCAILIVARCNSTTAPEKVELFVDDKPVYVEPGTTILQVCLFF